MLLFSVRQATVCFLMLQEEPFPLKYFAIHTFTA